MFDTFDALRRRCSQQLVARAESGATMAEYALLLALIALVAFTAVQLFGTAVSHLFTGYPSPF
ncbi:Flp family type IVb pilin [Flexivirga alba]|uniref:Flp family type IVb pilin n=1 Tax=Flexivirga alba TaxID=702742 RepID=A0ABW2AB71_9MICO